MRFAPVSRRLMAVAASGVLAAVAIVAGAGSGTAVPAADINQVAAQVRDLQMQASAAHEDALKAENDLANVRQRLGSVQDKLHRQRNELTTREATLGDLARSIYASGGIDPTLQVLLAEDPVSFLAQASVIDRVAASQADQIRQTQTSRLRLAQTEAEATDQETQAKALEDAKSAAEAQVNDKLDQAQALLATLKQEERDRIARLEAEHRLQEAEQARAAAAAAAAVAASGSGGGGGGAEASGGGYSGGSRAAAAVQYALSQVGDPYSYSANPPSSWDCSKLTAAAWGQAGVGLTALSYAQWDQTQHVPVDQIQPGDLVFYFGGGAHHVAIYVGNGKMVSASNPSDGVEITDFLGPWYKERFSGVGRVVG